MSKKTSPTKRRSESLDGSHHRYLSMAWRAEYGATMNREEVRLVQGFRGVNRETQELLLAAVSELVIAGPRASVIVALRRALRNVAKGAAHDIANLRAWAHDADLAARSGLPVQIPGGVR